ncbi:uncharacterized protein METZ01_LOCUS495743, partial [marine metagenome]
SDDPQSTECKAAKKKNISLIEQLKILTYEERERWKEERELEKQATNERKERIKKERSLEKQASLEEQKQIQADKATRKAERERLKAEWKKACSDDPESKACKEGKPSEKIKKSLLKIKKKLGG